MEKPLALFVDDSTRSLELMEQIIKTTKVDSLYINCAEDTVGILKRFESIKVIFLDIIMPGMNGFDLAKMIKKTFPKRVFKICFVSALRDEKYIDRAIKYGVFDYIVKPFNVSIIKDRLFKLLADSFGNKKFYNKQVEIDFVIENVPFNVDLRIKELNEMGGMLIASVDFKNKSCFYMTSPFLNEIIPTSEGKFNVVVTNILRLDTFNQVYFEFVDMDEASKEKLRSFVIT